MKVERKTYKKISSKCKSLLIMSFLSVVLLCVLNIYIGYLVVEQFKGDGWAFLGGLVLAVPLVYTIPAFVFSIINIRWIREDKKHKHVIPIILGISGMLMGIVLQNATGLWIYILIFSILLLVSAILCNNKETETPATANDNYKPNAKEIISVENREKKTKVQSYYILFVFQILEILFLFFGTVGSFASNYIIVGIVFSLLFVFETYLFIAFTNNKKWAWSTKLIESYVLLIITFLSFLGFVITDGISLSKESLLTVLIFSIIVALFIYQIISYKRIKKKGVFLTIVVLIVVNLLSPQTTYAQNQHKMEAINLLDTYYDSYLGEYNKYVDYYSTDIKSEYNHDKTHKYSSDNLFDGSFNTCWIAGSYKAKSYDTLYVTIPKKINLDKVILNIFSGYGKSKTLYHQNARPKKIKISIYAAYNPEGFVGTSGGTYYIKKYSEKFIQLKDTFDVQSFPLKLNKQKLMDFQKENVIEAKSSAKVYAQTYLGDENVNIKISDASLVLKIEILEVYKGTKYDDVCISELFFNNRFVTPYPLKYNKVENIYLKNDTILMADYANEKGVIVYKDTTAIFTMVDWVKNANFAILHYVLNDEAGAGSRIEEHYSIVDLKNRKIIDKEFERCTGYSPLFGIIEKKDGQLFIGNIGKFDIELK